MPQRLLGELAGLLGLSTDDSGTEDGSTNASEQNNSGNNGSPKRPSDRKGLATVMIALFALLGLNITDIQDGRFYSTLGLGGLLAVLILLQLSRDRDRASKERERSDEYHNKMLTDYRDLIVESTRANARVITLLESVVNEMRGQQQENRDLLKNYHSTLSALIHDEYSHQHGHPHSHTDDGDGGTGNHKSTGTPSGTPPGTS